MCFIQNTTTSRLDRTAFRTLQDTIGDAHHERPHLDFIHQLHGLDNTDRLTLRDLISNLHEGGLARGGRPVEGARHG